jgi:hypothetical protein
VILPVAGGSGVLLGGATFFLIEFINENGGGTGIQWLAENHRPQSRSLDNFPAVQSGSHSDAAVRASPWTTCNAGVEFIDENGGDIDGQK